MEGDRLPENPFDAKLLQMRFHKLKVLIHKLKPIKLNQLYKGV